jgi:protein-S-isoprenylcysteine O-methyltransferase Ste14
VTEPDDTGSGGPDPGELPRQEALSGTRGKVPSCTGWAGENGKEVKEVLFIIGGIWAVFLCWLFVPAFIRGGPKPGRISHRYIRHSLLLFVLVIAVFFLAENTDPGILLERFAPDTVAVGLAGIALTVSGLGFSAYARLHLGRNWSSMVMIRKGHRLIRTGPYRFVRNPMYTGMLMAFTGLILALGIVAALAALVILIVSLWMKIAAEEEILREEFGEEYEQYRRSVKALIPGIL